jgi:hypothetical protein
MATIYKDYGSGGAGLIGKAGISGGSGSARHASIADVLRDVADDLTACRGGVSGLTIASAAAGAALGAFTDPPSAGEMATLRTRVNEIITLVNDIRTVLNARVTAIGLTPQKTIKG